MNTFIFAIDGASPDLVNKWTEEGHLPSLKKIKDRGLSGKLESTFPPLTGPAWSSFQTGVNPGKHGVFNWLDMKDSYEGKVINSTSVKTDTVWDFISSQGGKVGLLSLPLTYPPKKVNGFVVPGFLTPKDSDYRSYPKELADKLENSFPKFSNNVKEYIGGSEEDWVDYLKKTARTRGKVGEYLIKKGLSEPIKKNNDFLFLMHFFATDLVQHSLWDRVTDEWDPRLEVFRVVDQVIGNILELAPENSSFIVISDHGFGPVERIFNVNNWLRKEGYLELKDSSKAWLKRGLSRLGLNQRSLKPLGEKIYPVAKSLDLASKNIVSAASHPILKACFLSYRDVNWDKTVAYSKSDIGHVRLNLSQREREGCVESEDAPILQEEIQKKLENVRIPDTGKRLADWVKLKEEIYSGPYLKDAPDLLFSPLTQNSLGFGAAMFISHELFVDSFKPGNHRRNGILMASGPSVQSGERNASIVDIAPTLLNLFNYPVPEQMDGEVIREISPDEPTYHRPADFYRSRKVKAEFDDSREKLANLGYL